MTPTHNNKEAIAHRRERVAYYRVRRVSIREIARRLEAEGIINFSKNVPWSTSTIAKDLKYLQSEWESEASQSIATHRARQIADLNEALRVAWSRITITEDGAIYKSEDIAEIRRLNETLMKLLGTAAPTQTQIGGLEGSPLLVKGYTNLDPDLWDEEG